MKKQTAIRLSVITVTMSLLFLCVVSCKKNASTNNTATTMTTFYFHLQPNIDTNKVGDTTTVYRDSIGRHFGLSVAQFFIYNVVLQNVNGGTYTIPDVYILTDVDSEQYIVGLAPPGTYNSLSFNVGLDAGTNNLQPSVFIPTGYASSNSMWYPSGVQGYMFMNLVGFVDTNTVIQPTDTNFIHFSYEIGSANNANIKTVTMPVRTGSPYQPYTSVAGGTDTISIICDYGKLLSVVTNFRTQDTTDTYSLNPTLSTTIANNIPNMFRYKQ